ncbi:MAG: extracellular solute-binding protein, partial [Alphaproteobacteria bacterium]
MRFDSKFGKAVLAAGLALSFAQNAAAEVNLQFFFPVAVGGKAANTIDGLTADYVGQTPGVKIDAVYAGSYKDTITKVLTAVKGGNQPQLSVILSVDMFTLIEEEAIVAFEDLITTDAERAWLGGFYPAFMENSQTGGKTYGVPFQRSTPVLYWNKDAFKEAGL